MCSTVGRGIVLCKEFDQHTGARQCANYFSDELSSSLFWGSGPAFGGIGVDLLKSDHYTRGDTS